MPEIAYKLQSALHAPAEHVSIMAGRDERGDVLTVFVSREWMSRLPVIPTLFEGVRVKVSKKGKVSPH